jgi:DNA ligase-1
MTFIKPMLLHYAPGNKPFDSPGTIAELKLDGWRLIASYIDEETRLYTRHGNDVTSRLPEINLHDFVPDGTVLDGEVIAVDPKTSHPDFFRLSSVMASRKKHHETIQFVAFDILQHAYEDTTKLPLWQRKALLATLGESDAVKRIPYMEGNHVDFFRLCKERGLEGIVIKDKNARYCPGERKSAFQKIVAYDISEVVILGWARKGIKWLIGEVIEGKLRPAGTLELGIPEEIRKAVFVTLLKTKTGENKEYIYVTPFIKLRVKHRGRTNHGLLRLPVYDDLLFG